MAPSCAVGGYTHRNLEELVDEDVFRTLRRGYSEQTSRTSYLTRRVECISQYFNTYFHQSSQKKLSLEGVFEIQKITKLKGEGRGSVRL